jgi:hypothetical protein
VGLLGPTNIADVTPSIQLALARRGQIIVESPAYWRMSTRDGVYKIDLRLLLDGSQNDERFVGFNPGVTVIWALTPHSTVTGTISTFFAGPFLRETFVGHGFRFYSSSLTYRF